MTAPLTHSDLAKFIGTENWYRHPLVLSITYTEGVKYLADRAEAHWLIDTIALLQVGSAVEGEPFQVWRLVVREDHSATLTCTDGGRSANDGVPITLYEELISYTDFPLDRIDIWVSGGVILLPREY